MVTSGLLWVTSGLLQGYFWVTLGYFWVISGLLRVTSGLLRVGFRVTSWLFQGYFGWLLGDSGLLRGYFRDTSGLPEVYFDLLHCSLGLLRSKLRLILHNFMSFNRFWRHASYPYNCSVTLRSNLTFLRLYYWLELPQWGESDIISAGLQFSYHRVWDSSDWLYVHAPLWRADCHGIYINSTSNLGYS